MFVDRQGLNPSDLGESKGMHYLTYVWYASSHDDPSTSEVETAKLKTKLPRLQNGIGLWWEPEEPVNIIKKKKYVAPVHQEALI